MRALNSRGSDGGLGFVLDSDWLGEGLLGLFSEGDTDLKLRLGLGGTVELLVDGDIVGFETEVGRSRVGVPLEDDIGFSGEVEEGSDVAFESLGDHVPKRHLSSAGDAVKLDLDSDHGVEADGGRSGSHGCDIDCLLGAVTKCCYRGEIRNRRCRTAVAR